MITLPDATLSLQLHARYGRKDIFGALGESYTSQDQNKNTGLSPRNPDGGYFLFITLNKEGLDPAYDYADELGLDWFRWTTRRGRGADHPDYVRLREATTRVSLFVRRRERENFAYLGELDYQPSGENLEPWQGQSRVCSSSDLTFSDVRAAFSSRCMGFILEKPEKS